MNPACRNYKYLSEQINTGHQVMVDGVICSRVEDLPKDLPGHPGAAVASSQKDPDDDPTIRTGKVTVSGKEYPYTFTVSEDGKTGIAAVEALKLEGIELPDLNSTKRANAVKAAIAAATQA